jgi:hypothetical protein
VPKAIGAVPLCKVPTLRRGHRPHHAQKGQIGTWEISRLTGSPSGYPALRRKVSAWDDDFLAGLVAA